MKIDIFKKCKRKKCPYYNVETSRCAQCEWNPDSVWNERKIKEKHDD